MFGEPVQVEYDNASAKRAGLNIEAASAFFSDETLTVLGELSSRSGNSIDDYRELQVIVYDAQDQAVGQALCNWIEFGLRQSFECSLEPSGYGYRLFAVPHLVRLIPARADADFEAPEQTQTAARFRPGTANEGRTVDWDGAQFSISGYATPLTHILQYDAQEELEWLSPEWREWSNHQRQYGLPPHHPLHGFGVTSLSQLDGRSFEVLCGMYFERLGFVVEQTPTVGDGGVDLVLRRGEELVLVQCKRHARPVGEAVLRDLYGALVHFGANSGVVCSSSGFTPAACKWAHEKAIRLVDGDEILKALA